MIQVLIELQPLVAGSRTISPPPLEVPHPLHRGGRGADLPGHARANRGLRRWGGPLLRGDASTNRVYLRD